MHWCWVMPSGLQRMVSRLLPSTLYARFFGLQVVLLTMIVLTFLALFSMNQTRSAMANIADVWTPAIEQALSRSAAPGSEEFTVSRQVQLLHGKPPADAYAPQWTHLRWRALQDALRARGVAVNKLLVSGRTGEAVVWLDTGDNAASRWVGVRSNLEGADFPARWAIAMALSMVFIGLAAWLLSRKIVTPLRQLQTSVQAFSDGKPLVVQAHDAPSEIRPLIRAFERMALEREDLDAQRALMLAGISHDIRSPLARIRMAAELLPAQGDVAEVYERIVRNVGIADSLIESFSDYVRADGEPLHQQVDLAELATLMAQATQVDCVIAPEASPAMVRGSEHLLQRALGNLIDNAKRHGQPPVVLTLDVNSAANHDEIRVGVADQGEGIAAQDRARLLRPFERGNSSRGNPGSGLGLAIVMRVAQRHGGRLEIHTPARGGSVCVLVLPKSSSKTHISP
jgi:two-component system, OmpR family, osmolarity sensor histidine kinase EnvZ